MASLPGLVSNVLGGVASKTQQLADSIREKGRRAPSYPIKPGETGVLRLVDDAKRVRLATLESFEPVWTRCILFASGVQHLRYLPTTRQFTPPKTEDWMPRPTFNYIQNKVERIVDFFTRNRPTAFIQPESRKETDRAAAAIGETVRESLWIANDEEDLFDEAATTLVTVGNVFKRNYIDTSMRQLVHVPRTQTIPEPILGLDGQPIIGEDGMPATVERYEIERDPETGAELSDEVRQGELDSYICGPLSMTVPLAAPARLDRSPWLMESSLQSLELIRQLYPDKAEFISPKAAVVTSDLYQHRITSLLTSGIQGVIRAVDPYSIEGFGVVNYYERAPEPEFPKGLCVVEYDGIPLWIGTGEDGLPIQGEYSYSHCGYYRVPGRFWFRGMVEDLVHPQEQLNKTEQALQVNDAYMGNPCWVVPTEAGLAEGSMGNRPGKVYRYKYPYKPDRVDGKELPQQVLARRAMYVQDIEQISGAQNVVMGDAPPGVTAGVALNRLGEEAEGLFAPIMKRWDRFIERDQTKKMQLVQRYYTVPRYIAANRDGTLQEIHDFIGLQLRGNVRVKIEAGSYRPRSKSGQVQLMIDALGLGLLPGVLSDPEQLREFLTRMGVAGFDPPESLDAKRAKWENEMLVRSEGWQQIQRQPSDNDVIHLMVHTNFEKTSEWLAIPQSVRQRFGMHVIEHLMAVIKNQGAGDSSQIAPPEQDLEPAGSPAGDSSEPGAPGDGAPGQNGQENANAPASAGMVS